MAALAVVLLGLGLYAAAWLRLCRHVARAEGADREDALALVRHATVVWSAPLVLAPPLFSRDGWSYAAQGVLTHFRISPYEHGPGVLVGPIVQGVDPRWMETAAPYGPIPLLFGDAVAGFTGNPWMLVIAHRSFALIGLALLAWSVPRLAAWAGINPALSSAVVLCSPLMLAHGVGGLHNDLLMVGLMTSALVLAAERGWMWGAALGGLAAAVKLPGGLVCIGVALIALPVGASISLRVRRLAQVGAVAVRCARAAGPPRRPRRRLGACPGCPRHGEGAALDADHARRLPRPGRPRARHRAGAGHLPRPRPRHSRRSRRWRSPSASR